MRLTDEQRKKIAPTRASGLARMPTARSAKRLAKALKRHERDSLEALRRGVDVDVEPELRPLREAAFAVAEKRTVEAVAETSLEALGMAEMMLRKLSRRDGFLDAVVVAHGAAAAVEVMRRAFAFKLEARDRWTVAFAVRADWSPRHQRGYQSWLPLRHAVCAADDEEYARACERARDGWDARTMEQNARFAYAFPDEPWAEALLRSRGATAPVASSVGGTPRRVPSLGFLLGACSDVEVCWRVARAASGPFEVSRSAFELGLALPPDDALAIYAHALPRLLEKPKHGPLHKTPPRHVVAAMAALDTPEAAAEIAARVGDRIVGKVADAFFRDRPEHRAALRGEGASAAAGRLADELDALDAAAANAAPLASEGEVPVLLRARAWRPPKKEPKVPTIRDVAIAEPFEERVDLPATRATSADVPELSGERLEAWRTDLAGKGWTSVDERYDYASRTRYRPPREEGLAAWNRGDGSLSRPVGFLAEHGTAAIEGFAVRRQGGNLDYEGADEWIEAYSRIESPRVATAWARIGEDRKRWRKIAYAWLRAHVEHTALGLIPAAVGPKGKDRKAATAALRHLILSGHADAIRAAAGRYEEEVRAAVDLLLARDPRIVDAKPPKPPPFLRVEQLPPLELRAGSRLPDEARDALLELLSVAPVGHPGFDALREALDPASLDAFVTALVEQWAAAEGPGRHDWMVRAAASLPGPASARRVAELARAWARSKKAPAQRACDALAAIGTDAALLHLGHVAATTRFDALRKSANERMDEVARARGLSREELEDRTVPDLGLDERGRLALAFGERALTATLDETFGVVLLDEEGAPLRSFPRGAKGDAERTAAKARYDELKRDAKAIADRQRRRLERAMASGRAWSLDEARLRLFEHPAARHLARGLVWSSGETAFRVAEDGTFASVNDEAVELASDAEVRIAHPLRLDDVEAWSRVFADYELLQPFPQLGRAVHRASVKERRRDSVDLVKGRSLAPQKALGLLESRGWRREAGGMVSCFERQLGGGVVATLAVTPFEFAYLRGSPDIELGAVELRRDGEPVRAGELDEVAYSELVHDLDALL